ncbi:MAG TPA: ribonuclease HI family protein [Polyangiaceae bacterium]
MAETRDKAELLERLAERADLSDEERAVLREAAARFRGPVAAPSSAPARSRPSRSERRARKSNPGAVPATDTALADLDAILWSDGAARGNPGPAGAGAVVKNGAGEVLAECSAYLGHTTNNVAEYKAVLLGLERALELGIRRIEVRADSELLIKQLRGEYRVRHEALKPLYEAAQRLLARFEKKKLVHVRREQNGDADRLANLGIDSR